MKWTLSFFIICLLIPSQEIIAKGLDVKIGRRISWLNTEESHREAFWIIGAGFEQLIGKSKSFALAAELYAGSKGGFLQGIISGSPALDFYEIQDVHITIRYVEIPLVLRKYLAPTDLFRLQLFGGVAFSLALIDRTKFIQVDEILISEFQPRPNLDYEWSLGEDDPVQKSSTLDLNLGLGFVHQNYLFQLRYSKNLKGNLSTLNLIIDENVHTLDFSFGRKF